MTQDDEEPTAEELADAERLARALDSGHSAGAVPEDALGAAALLRFAKDGGALSPERSERILEDALAQARPRTVRPRFAATLLGLLGLSAAGVAFPSCSWSEHRRRSRRRFRRRRATCSRRSSPPRTCAPA